MPDEKTPIHVGQLFATHPISGAGGIGPNDLTKIDRLINPSNPAAGVNSYAATYAELLQFIASNMAAIDLPIMSWVPTVSGSSTNPTFTGFGVTGRFVRIGRLAHVEVRLQWATRTGGSGRLLISKPPELGAFMNHPIPLSFARGVTLPAHGSPGWDGVGVTHFVSNGFEVHTAVDALGAAGGVLAFSGTVILPA